MTDNVICFTNPSHGAQNVGKSQVPGFHSDSKQNIRDDNEEGHDGDSIPGPRTCQV
jgi:hypothetical protein